MWLRDQLANGIGTSHQYIEQLASRASSHYRTTTIPKRTGGVRMIWMPSPELKAAQRWLVRKVLHLLPTHPAAAAYEPGMSIVANARRHCGSRYLLRLDFSRFFESITASDVRTFMDVARAKITPHWSSADTDLFTRIVCWRNQLVIGAVSSPSLTNRMCFDLDSELGKASEASGVEYSRYADDMFFSTSTPDVLRRLENVAHRVVTELRVPAALKLNRRKTLRLSRRNRRTVTGLVLTSDGQVSLGRERKRKIRAMLHQLRELNTSDRSWLKGTISFCRDVEPAFIDRLVLKYGAALLEGAMK